MNKRTRQKRTTNKVHATQLQLDAVQTELAVAQEQLRDGVDLLGHYERVSLELNFNSEQLRGCLKDTKQELENVKANLGYLAEEATAAKQSIEMYKQGVVSAVDATAAEIFKRLDGTNVIMDMVEAKAKEQTKRQKWLDKLLIIYTAGCMMMVLVGILFTIVAL